MDSSSVIDLMYEDHRALIEYLDGQEEISLRSTVGAIFPKTLAIAAGSYFEERIRGSIYEFIAEASNGQELIIEFTNNKAIERQYHTYFDWRGRNANQFFGLFGQNFRSHMETTVRGDSELDEAVKSFLEMGNIRNTLVHENFIDFAFAKTAEEMYQMYQKALLFVERLPELLREYPRQELNVNDSTT